MLLQGEVAVKVCHFCIEKCHNVRKAAVGSDRGKKRGKKKEMEKL